MSKVALREPRKTASIAGLTYKAGVVYDDPDGKLAEYQLFNRLVFRVVKDEEASTAKPAGKKNGDAVSETRETKPAKSDAKSSAKTGTKDKNAKDSTANKEV